MRGCPKDQATEQNFSGRGIIYQNTPLTSTPHPSLLLFTAGKKKKKKGPETFYGKVLKGRKGTKKKGGEKKKGEGESESHKIWNNSIGIFHVYAL